MSETDLEEIDMSAKSSANPSLAARAGRWSAQHRKKAIWGWLAFALIAFMIGGAIGTKTQTNAQSGVGESGRAARTVDNAFPKHQVEEILVQSDSATASERSFRAVVGDVQRRLSAVPYTNAFESPYKPANAGQISADGHSALLRFEIAGDQDQASNRVGATLKATAAAQAANPNFTVEQVGDASINKQLNDSINKDFSRAFVTSLPITLAILLIAFGALVAASLPILLAMTAVLATIGLVAVTSQFAPVDSSINEVILLIGLAVGVDYSMFYLRREREERASGRSPEASLEAAAATSGRAVLVSGLTVMVAMAGMYLGGASTFTSFATGTIIVVAVAVAGSLTVLPALLAWLGDRVEKGRRPVHQEDAVERHREWHLGADPDSRPTAAPPVGNRRDEPADRAGDSRLQHPYGEPGHRHAAAEPECGQDLQQGPEGLSRWTDPRGRRGKRRERDLAPGRRRHQRASQAGRGKPVVQAADHDDRQLRSHGRGDRHPPGRGWQRLALERRAGPAAQRSGSSHDRAGRERHGGRGWLHRQLAGLQRHDEVAPAARLRLRPDRRPSCCCW